MENLINENIPKNFNYHNQEIIKQNFNKTTFCIDQYFKLILDPSNDNEKLLNISSTDYSFFKEKEIEDREYFIYKK